MIGHSKKGEKIMKKLTTMLFAFLVVVGLLTACSDDGSESKGSSDGKPSGEITVWGWNVAADAMRLAVDGFKEKYPDVEVKVEDIGRLDVYDKLTVGLASGGAGLPDVVLVESDRIANYQEQFPDSMLNLSEMGYDKHADKFGEYKLSVTQNDDGKFIAAPWDIGPIGVFYRTDIYKEAGVNPEEIKTWDDFVEAGKKIKEKTGTSMVAIDKAKDDAIYRMMLNQQGSYYFTEEGEIAVNSKASKNAFEVLKKLNEEELALNVDGWNGTVAATINGEIASVPFGVWYTGTITDQAPDLSGKWGVYQLPAFEEGGNRAANLGGSDLVIPSSTDNKEAAYAFVEYFTTEEEPQITGLKEKGLFPALSTVYDNEFFQKKSEYFSSQQIYKMFSEEVKNIPVANYTSDYARAFKIMSDTQAAILLNGVSIEEALQNATEKLKSATGREVK